MGFNSAFKGLKFTLNMATKRVFVFDSLSHQTFHDKVYIGYCGLVREPHSDRQKSLAYTTA
jgi:hypothetical protein